MLQFNIPELNHCRNQNLVQKIQSFFIDFMSIPLFNALLCFIEKAPVHFQTICLTVPVQFIL